MHLHVMGEGSPAVILEAGLGASSLSWQLVQPELARLTQVCSYDRPGLGWSDPGRTPPTSRAIVEQLRRLLQTAGVPPPYVLVGHSFGGFTARLYASLYPQEVAGMVLLDALHPREWLTMTEPMRRAVLTAVRLCRRGALLAEFGAARLIAVLVGAGMLQMARWFAGAVSGGALRERERMLASVNKLPAALRPVIRAHWCRPHYFRAVASQIEALPESAAQVAATGDYGSIPLVVLSASNPAPDRVAEQEVVARLSTRGSHRVAEQSGHWIQLDQPQLVIDVVREIVEAARRNAPAAKTS